jgi:hypothetical protein
VTKDKQGTSEYYYIGDSRECEPQRSMRHVGQKRMQRLDGYYEKKCPISCGVCISTANHHHATNAHHSTIESKTEETQLNVAAAVAKRVVAIANDVVVDNIVKITFTKVLANRVRRGAV